MEHQKALPAVEVRVSEERLGNAQCTLHLPGEGSAGCGSGPRLRTPRFP